MSRLEPIERDPDGGWIARNPLIAQAQRADPSIAHGLVPGDASKNPEIQ